MRAQQTRKLLAPENYPVARLGSFWWRGILSFTCLTLVLGCATNSTKQRPRHQNELGQFILDYTMKHGACPMQTNDLPAITSRWAAAFDSDGVQIETHPGNYEAIKGFLHQAFGDPSIEVTETTDGGLLGVYAARDAGLAIQFGKKGAEQQGAFLVIIHPHTSELPFLGRGKEAARPETMGDPDQPKTEPAYIERERRIVEELTTLVDLATSIVSDEAVEEDEVRALKGWLNAKPERSGYWFGRAVSQALEDLLCDAQINREELEALLPWLKTIAKLAK